MLDITNVSKTFNAGTVNEKRALDSVELHLNSGDFVTVIGSNGAGKSTLLNAVAGTWPVDSGSIVIGGQDVTGLPDYKRASLLGRVFQDPMRYTACDFLICRWLLGSTVSRTVSWMRFASASLPSVRA